MSMLEHLLGDYGIADRIVGDPTLSDVVFTDRTVNNYRDAHLVRCLPEPQLKPQTLPLS